MKFILFTIVFCIISISTNCQALQGEWKGSYTISYLGELKFGLKLLFVQTKDSSYKVYSYSHGKDSKGKDTTIVCEVFYKLTEDNSIMLEETKVLKPENQTSSCLQIMYLKIKKRKQDIILDGTWESKSNDCPDHGSITFTKIYKR